MSGHSKWNNIKHKKEKSDAAKGKIFTKIGREIAVAVKAGGADPNSNSELRNIIAKAKANNIPNDNIARSIKKASGEMGNINYEALTYEGYGPSGTALIVETLTDNKNRTVGDVRHCFDKMGGNVGASGCVSYMFETKGVLLIERTSEADDEELMMIALDAGADDFNADEDVYEILTQPADLGAVRETFEQLGKTIVSSEVDRIPANKVALDAEQAVSFNKLIDMLEELDDVQNVFHNADLPEEDDED